MNVELALTIAALVLLAQIYLARFLVLARLGTQEMVIHVPVPCPSPPFFFWCLILF